MMYLFQSFWFEIEESIALSDEEFNHLLQYDKDYGELSSET